MRILTLSLALTLAPLAALAEAPAVGTVLGTDPATATAALGAAGCPQATFDAEGLGGYCPPGELAANHTCVAVFPSSGAMNGVPQRRMQTLP